ncbi:hypothetical protein GCM10023063_22260 [Arthrobacter methylotrophus]
MAKLDTLARSVTDARDIAEHLVRNGVKLSIGRQTYDPTALMGKMFFDILPTFAEFEVDRLRVRTREGMAIAEAKGRLRGRDPNSAPSNNKNSNGNYMITDPTDMFSVSRTPSTAHSKDPNHDHQKDPRSCPFPHFTSQLAVSARFCPNTTAAPGRNRRRSGSRVTDG